MYTVVVEDHVPIPEHPPTFEDLRERVDAAFAALQHLGDSHGGIDIEVSDADQQIARDLLFNGHKPTEVDLSSPGVIVQIKALLTQYDKTVVESAAQIRTFVTNRLILESDNQDPRIRMKALELLGKISDVGLFTDKTEITMRHRPTEELEQMLKERLTVLLKPEDVMDVQPLPPIADEGDDEFRRKLGE